MFGAKKTKIEDYGFGALRSATPAVAPRMEFNARGRESKVDLRKYCSPVQDQLTIGSCNACAIVGALEFQMLKGGRPLTPLSPLYVYYNGRKLAGMEREVARLEEGYAGRQWLAGDRLSLVDLFVAPIVQTFGMFPEGQAALAKAPTLSRNQAEMEKRPSFLQAHAGLFGRPA